MNYIGGFDVLCAALRRNDPDTTKIPFLLMQDYGPRLGEALEGNEYVSSMELDLACLLDASVESTDSVALLLRYVRESKAMRSVHLKGGWMHPRPEVVATLVRLIFQAIADNPCIENLILWNDIETTSDSIASLMGTAHSIKRLHIRLHGVTDNASLEVVGKAVGSSRMLESLELQEASSTYSVESFLLRLGPHPLLRELKLYCLSQRERDPNPFAGLAYFLRSTTSLKHLCLRNYIFHKERMERLAEGLHSNHSLTKLSMAICRFDVEATDVFRSFMRSGETRSSIRELCINGSDGMFDGSSAGAMLASTLITPYDNQGSESCIASSLQVLDLNCDFAGFCHTLGAHASRIRLACLRRTSRVGHNDWEALCRCLPKLVYLRELSVPLVDSDVSSWKFVDALRENGSLQRVALADSNREETPFFNERQKNLIQSFCKRNEAIPILVAKCLIGTDKDDDNSDDKTDLSLLPAIFECAKQAPRTAPNSTLIALLEAGDTIGPRYGVKRPCQHTMA